MIELLPALIYTADAITRADLARDDVLHEREYMGALLARTKDLWRLAGSTTLVRARQATPNEEKYRGVDAVIAIQVQEMVKVIAFEAKRPGFAIHLPKWDQKQSKSKQSRFSRQVVMQNVLQTLGWTTGAFFIDERDHYSAKHIGAVTAAHPLMNGDALGGKFVLHKHLLPIAQAKLLPGAAHAVWKHRDLAPLLSTATGLSMNLQQLLQSVIDCTEGLPAPRSLLREALRGIREAPERRPVGVDDPHIGQRDSPAYENIRFLDEVMHAVDASCGLLVLLDRVSEARLAEWRLRTTSRPLADRR